MKLLQLIHSALLLILLAHCAQISPQQKARIKRVVVVCDIVEPRLDHFKQGITVFGNETLDGMPLLGMKKDMMQMIRKETSMRFAEVIIVEGALGMDEQLFAVMADPTSEAMKLARKHNADAVLRLCVRGYVPPGFPAVGRASFGAWHPDPLGRLVGQNDVLITCCCGQTLFDQATGKMITSSFSPGISTVKSVRFEKSFGNYSAETHSQFRKASLEAFSRALLNSLHKLGY